MKNIVFAQAQDNNKAVVANKYVAHALYEQNKAIVESLGGKIVKGVGGFRAEFKTVANAKKFVADAITEMSKKEYNAARKVAEGSKKSKPVDEGSKKPKTSTKGNTRKGKGNVAPTKAKTEVKKATKGKGNVELTEAGKKALERMKASVLNRAASAYSIANGGVATTYSALGKSAKDLSAYIPNAKVALLKSDKWAKASKTHGLTEDMLG